MIASQSKGANLSCMPVHTGDDAAPFSGEHHPDDTVHHCGAAAAGERAADALS